MAAHSHARDQYLDSTWADEKRLACFGAELDCSVQLPQMRLVLVSAFIGTNFFHATYIHSYYTGRGGEVLRGCFVTAFTRNSFRK